jgi:FlaA1/EpsC-like NDP-sugar epimerase
MHEKIKTVMRADAMRWAMVLGAQAWIFAFCGLMAFMLRFDFSIPAASIRHLLFAVMVWVVVKSAAFQFANLNRRGLRYISISDLYRLLTANLAGSVIGCGTILWIGPSGFPRSIYLSDFILSIMGTIGMRVVVRISVEGLGKSRSDALERRAFIYGAGYAGITLLKEIRNNRRLAYHVCGFLDDDLLKLGARRCGARVVGGGDQIDSLVAEHEVDIILIAIPSASGTEMTRILSSCHAAGVECKTIPGLGEVIEGRGLACQIREVAVEDLLGRTPVRLEGDMIRSALAKRVVMVTGAAGSIGSELCRQIARFHPAGIVGFEIAESPLFDIDREMCKSFPRIPFYPEIGSVQNRARLNDVLHKYRPAVVFHAAAYKHVPLMEEHVFEAIENNVFGTYNLAVAAAEFGVEDFVMISSDKAVRPTNVMGATKRVAELLLLALQNGRTKYVAVRFGNVLGSNGSVVPIFKKQIAAGGPVTVTHPEMRRYFMTIPEACQLVLQASAIGKGGQICVLDMGQPIKIIDLAKKLILLSGLEPEKDIEIKITGMRPGEKLYEEVSSLLEDTVPTAHEKIRIFVGDGMPEDIQSWLDDLRDICTARDAGRLVVALKEMVLDYNPSTHLLQRILHPRSLAPVGPHRIYSMIR